MEEISRGAEAVIFRDDARIVKRRVKKGYRIAEIDERLRSFRTRREAKILKECPIPSPRFISSDGKESIDMEFVEGPKVRDILDSRPELCVEIGQKLGMLHNKGIIHGDLTTANMILGKEIFFIDFGLSFISSKLEDKAVDIHLFMQALESKHFRVFEKAKPYFLKGYAETAEDHDKILQRLAVVEARGRNKAKF